MRVRPGRTGLLALDAGTAQSRGPGTDSVGDLVRPALRPALAADPPAPGADSAVDTSGLAGLGAAAAHRPRPARVGLWWLRRPVRGARDWCRHGWCGAAT